MSTTPTVDSILMGGGAQQAKFATPGTTFAGRIVQISDPYQEREYDPTNPGNGAPKFFKSGTPIMSFYVDIDTGQRDPNVEDDDGIRRVYMDGQRIKKATKAAVLASGARGLTVGGHLTITYTSDEVPGDSRSGKNWTVVYQQGNAASNVLMGEQEAPAAPAATFNPVQAQQTGHGWGQQQPAPQAPAAPAPAAAPGPAAVAAVKAAGVDPRVAFATSHPQWAATYQG